MTDVPGILAGHATDLEALTGCTVILCEQGAVAGVDIGGGATGTQEFDTLSPLHVTSVIHGLVFSGGSAFGLEAASGVRNYLEQKGVGYAMGQIRVPIVPSAILFDLGIGKAGVRPTREMGEAAAKAASGGPVEEGCVGAGTGATVGKLHGMKQAMKGGIGTYTVQVGHLMVSAMAVVNAFGDVRDSSTGRIVAGARKTPEGRDFADTEKALLAGVRNRAPSSNTTLVAVATNAKLSKVAATRLARMSQTGVTRTLSPGHTMGDGDVVIALSLGEIAADMTTLGVAAAEAVAQAILRGIQKARTLGGVPGLAG